MKAQEAKRLTKKYLSSDVIKHEILHKIFGIIRDAANSGDNHVYLTDYPSIDQRIFRKSLVSDFIKLGYKVTNCPMKLNHTIRWNSK